jgi:hypothetical protein
VGSCTHRIARPLVADGGVGLQMWRVAANILKRGRGQQTRGGPPARGLDEGLKSLHRKKKMLVTICYTGPPNWTDCLERPRQGKWI